MPSSYRKFWSALLVALLWGVVGAPAQGANSWVWPMDPHELSVGFDRPAQNWLPGHRGIDLVGSAGTQVHAAGSGIIFFAGQVGGKGVVVVKHGVLRTTYEPVVASVTLGARVRAGDVLGTLQPGNSHCASATTVTCLHWGLIRGTTYLNPLALVQKRVRLLPQFEKN
jgi:murein DD-endopeptidase MepM/ murein hydrolase activator NlpD